MKKFTLLFTLLLSCTLVFTQTIFLDGGNSLPADAPQGQEVISYSWGSSFPDGSGEVTVSMMTGTMSAPLMQATAMGSIIPKMELKVYDDQNRFIARYTFFDVMVMSYQISGTNDQVTLRYSRIKSKEFNR